MDQLRTHEAEPRAPGIEPLHQNNSLVNGLQTNNETPPTFVLVNVGLKSKPRWQIVRCEYDSKEEHNSLRDDMLRDCGLMSALHEKVTLQWRNYPFSSRHYTSEFQVASNAEIPNSRIRFGKNWRASMPPVYFESDIVDAVEKKDGPRQTEDWENVQQQITQLYVTDGKKLREVMQIMELVHGFKATERQYKRRITNWGLDNKNIRESDMKFLLSKQQKRKLEYGKETEFMINGRIVPPRKMQRFMQRKEISQEDLVALQVATPAHISYHTPHAGTQDGSDDGESKTRPSCSNTLREVLNGSVLSATDNQERNSQTLDREEDRGFQILLATRALGEASISKSSASTTSVSLVIPASSARPGEGHRSNGLQGVQERNFPAGQELSSLRGISQIPEIYTATQTEVTVKNISLARLRDESTPSPFEGGEPQRSNHMKMIEASSAPSPFERWSQRYDIAESPSWIRSYMTPRNPLSITSPAPVGTPWNHAETPKNYLEAHLKLDRDLSDAGHSNIPMLPVGANYYHHDSEPSERSHPRVLEVCHDVHGNSLQTLPESDPITCDSVPEASHFGDFTLPSPYAFI